MTFLRYLLLFFMWSLIGENAFSQVDKIPDEVKNAHDKLQEYYEGKRLTSTSLTRNDVTKNTAFLQKYYDSVTEYYRYFKSDKKIIKGVRVYTDNDAFAVFDNRDHEYTGGVRIAFITDYVGLKLISFRRDHKYLSYQSVFFGFDLYTPNVLNVNDIGDLNPIDRPFASFQYIGRTRNIIRYDGRYRSTAEIKIGIIGGEVSRNFQRVIHRDITDSENNNGWNYQIANGGRFALQYMNNHQWENKLGKKELYFHYGFQYGLGWEKNYVSPMLSLTNKCFFERNPDSAINSENHFFGSQKWWDQIKQTAFFAVNVQPEIVFYNTMLQGYPTNNKEFVFDEGNKVEVPVINPINHVVGKFSFSFGFRNYNSNFLFEYFFQTPEYDYAWKKKFFHRYGRISFTLNI
ncbi:lipid A-modifier LpxR family protein [uncultured Tenacibaculum sp.]|uniref:lipid A-modifier LpxR family protein n=1 Tax=uncultured Tenacibaculum sp. TaxID=174713 RepID=UPI00261AE26E|nr:lipid A-modifier LpxR family protein [uncultured Tenacibaculum sp.]